MCRIATSIAVFVFCAFAVSWSAIINIPVDYPTIQQGIDASVDGDTVLVQPGIYYENIDFNGHNIVLASLYLISGDTSYISSTVIDGCRYSSVVKFQNCENEAAEIAGFKVQQGYATIGGGILCNYSSPTICHNILEQNVAFMSYGGAIYCHYSDPIISENIIRLNFATAGGGGIYCYESDPGIIRNIISYNRSNICGGGLMCVWSAPAIILNEIYGNRAVYGGGIMCEWYSSPRIYGNRIKQNSASGERYGSGGGIRCSNGSCPEIAANSITDNYAREEGGGISIHYYSDPVIENNTITENSADSAGGGICCLNHSNPVITNTICWKNMAQSGSHEILNDSISYPRISYCDIRDTLWPGEGNISVNPLFRNSEEGDYHLMSTACSDSTDSPCIDSGDPNILDSLLGCTWGLGGLRSDMGAFGGGDVQVDIGGQFIQVPEIISLAQNYPNPFNAQTTVSFILPEAGFVQLTICDLLGRRIQTLIDGFLQAGSHSIGFDASHLPSGVYFYRLQAGHVVETGRMVLLK